MRNVVFQLHWLLGITAGVVLAIVGVTGAVLSFEHQILDLLNADVKKVTVRPGGPLEPPELLERIRSAHPDRRILSLVVSGEPDESARVTFAFQGEAGERPQQGPPGRGPRGESHYVDPYTGELIPGAGNRGEAFFRAAMQLHRWLMVGGIGDRDIGRQIVGASTIALIFFAVSGIYLRWPHRRARDWRVWLTFNPRMKGSRFLWHLHAVAGTWVVVFYLIMGLTGLYWSYEWYRDGLYALTGTERPQQGPQGQRGGGVPVAERGEPVTDISRAWDAFVRETESHGFSTATLNLSNGDAIEIRYLDAAPRHERAFNTLRVAADGAVQSHDRYADRPFGARLVASIFPLHSGSYFGIVGTVLFMFASLAMPLFTVTGWMLYLERRRRKRMRLSESAPSTARAAPRGFD